MMADIFWPFDPSCVSEWPGARGANWADHIGTDFAVPQGTRLRATISGIVDIIWNDGLGAWVIDIIAPDGTVARHGHLSYMHPRDGAWVDAGDYIGNTGGALGTPGAGLSTGSHLHWELRNNNGWGAWGWYDPRNLAIRSFDRPPAKHEAKPTPPPPIHGMENHMIIYYAHALGKGKKGWLVLGFTPKPLILSTQEFANAWQQRIKRDTIVAGYASFKSHLASAGGTRLQLARVSQG